MVRSLSGRLYSVRTTTEVNVQILEIYLLGGADTEQAFAERADH